ncbi:MAG: O-antigen ligase family protein [Betaproteobacteria bacterium]|nr:O-antigen ligase family protein [Betaproteobacteria bacterium]
MQPERLRQIALVAALAVPLGLLHAFVGAEICIGLVDLLFLVHSWHGRNFAWSQNVWFLLAASWWLWLLFCSTPLPWSSFGTDGWRGFIQAFVIIRLILFTAALQSWILTTPKARRMAWIMLALSCLWIGVESWQQYLTGRNIFGNPRFLDGSLTGPFWKPRAGALYSHLLYIAMLPVVLALLIRPGRWGRIMGTALVAFGVTTSVLIGQRMGVALTGMGLLIAGYFLRPMRLPLTLALAAGVVVVLATPIISPSTHNKLVGETERNLGDFIKSPYGEIFTVAANMGVQSPWHGWGYRSYRVSCLEPRFNTGLPTLGIGPTKASLGACNLHPQNYYLQAFCESGVPGLLLFIALMGMSTWKGMQGLWRTPDPLRVGLLIGVMNYTWPIASTDEFPTLYMLGWFFFFLGFAPSGNDAARLSMDPNHD